MCEKVEHTYPLGNVYEGFNHKKVNMFFDKYYDAAKTKCKKCPALRLCSMCAVDVLKNGRYDKESRDNFCKYRRKSLKKELTDYCSILEENPKAFDYMKKIKIS